MGNDLHLIKLNIPKIFYVNQRSPKEERESDGIWKKVNKLLPRSYPAQHLYEYTIPEEMFKKHNNELVADLSSPDIEGIYETQVCHLVLLKHQSEYILKQLIAVPFMCSLYLFRLVPHTHTDTVWLCIMKSVGSVTFYYTKILVQ